MQISETETLDLSLEELDSGWENEESDRETSHRVALLRAYFARFGLSDREALDAAARRVVTAVRKATNGETNSEMERRLVVVARTWIRDFAGSGEEQWTSRAPALLSKFPSAFLATPLTGPPRSHPKLNRRSA